MYVSMIFPMHIHTFINVCPKTLWYDDVSIISFTYYKTFKASLRGPPLTLKKRNVNNTEADVYKNLVQILNEVPVNVGLISVLSFSSRDLRDMEPNLEALPYYASNKNYIILKRNFHGQRIYQDMKILEVYSTWDSNDR